MKFNIVIFETVDIFYIQQLLHHNIIIVDSYYEVLVLLRRIPIDIILTTDKIKENTIPYILISDTVGNLSDAQDILLKETFSVQRVEFACLRAKQIKKYFKIKEENIIYLEFIKTLSLVQDKAFNQKIEPSILHEILLSFFLSYNLYTVRLDKIKDYNYTCKIIFNKEIKDIPIKGIIPPFWRELLIESKKVNILEHPKNIDLLFFGNFSIISSKIHNYIFSIYYYKIEDSTLFIYKIIKNLLSWVIKEIEETEKIKNIAARLDESLKEINYQSNIIDNYNTMYI